MCPGAGIVGTAACTRLIVVSWRHRQAVVATIQLLIHTTLGSGVGSGHIWPMTTSLTMSKSVARGLMAEAEPPAVTGRNKLSNAIVERHTGRMGGMSCLVRVLLVSAGWVVWRLRVLSWNFLLPFACHAAEGLLRSGNSTCVHMPMSNCIFVETIQSHHLFFRVWQCA